jgi:hypothetical protein
MANNTTGVKNLVILEKSDLSWMAHQAFRTASGKTPNNLIVKKNESLVGDSFMIGFSVRNLEMKKINKFVKLFYDKTGTIIPMKDIRISIPIHISKHMTRNNKFWVTILVDETHNYPETE